MRLQDDQIETASNRRIPRWAIAVTVVLLLAGGILVVAATRGGAGKTSEKNLDQILSTGDTAQRKVSFNPTPSPLSAGKSAKGSQAPDFDIPALRGGRLRLRDFRGKVVMLDFWSVACAPCIYATAHLQKLYKKYGDKGFTVIGINLDMGSPMAKDFVNKLKLKLETRSKFHMG